jgi:hypothetical protein
MKGALRLWVQTRYRLKDLVMDIPLLSTPSSDIITHEIAQLERIAEGDYSARLNDSLGNTAVSPARHQRAARRDDEAGFRHAILRDDDDQGSRPGDIDAVIDRQRFRGDLAGLADNINAWSAHISR